MHTKTLMVDGVWSIFGSANFDNRSLELNDEMNVAVTVTTWRGAFRTTSRPDLKASRRITSRNGAAVLACRRCGERFWTAFGEVSEISMTDKASLRCRVGSPRRRPAISTSAARARRSSTGSSRAGTAARSSCASKTPTPSVRRATWSPASSTGCAGSGSTGTKGPDVGGPHAPYFQSQRLDGIAPLRDGSSPTDTPTTATAPRSGSQERERAEAARRRLEVRPHVPARCQPTRSRALEAAGTPRAIRFKVPAGETAFDDLVHGPIEFDNAQHRRLRHPALRRPSDLSPLRRRRRHRHGDHRT